MVFQNSVFDVGICSPIGLPAESYSEKNEMEMRWLTEIIGYTLMGMVKKSGLAVKVWVLVYDQSSSTL